MAICQAPGSRRSDRRRSLAGPGLLGMRSHLWRRSGVRGPPPRRRPASARPAATQAPPSPQAPKPLSCAARVFSRMTAAQRAGQLFMVGIAGSPASKVARAVAAYHFGSLLFGTTTAASLTELRQVTAADQALASATATAQVRFFIAADQEGGEVQRLRGPGFAAIPSAVTQGELAPGTLKREAAGWGRELRQAGVNLDLAPVMDVVPAWDRRAEPAERRCRGASSAAIRKRWRRTAWRSWAWLAASRSRRHR